MELTEQIRQQLVKISTLLRNRAFAVSMADTLKAAYEQALEEKMKQQDNEPTKDVEPAGQKTAGNEDLSAEDQKIATNLAGFYAVECGVGLLIALRGGTPENWLEKIVANTIEPDDLLVLTRFANATWKAGQPFRGLDRITRPSFIPAAFLSEEEIEKDRVQIRAAARKLIEALIVI